MARTHSSHRVTFATLSTAALAYPIVMRGRHRALTAEAEVIVGAVAVAFGPEDLA